MKRVLMAFVRAYRKWISPLFPPSCRYRPTCSAYALEALELHGALRGTWLTLRRLLKCHPLCAGGFDPVPRSKFEAVCSGETVEANAESIEDDSGRCIHSIQKADSVDTGGKSP